MPTDSLRHDLDDLGRTEHARLGRIDAHVLDHGVYLTSHELGGEEEALRHAQGVLRGDRCQGGRPEDAEGGHRLEVGLDPGAP